MQTSYFRILKTAIALTIVSFTGNLLAATFTVTKTTDLGQTGELRWAIQQSNSTPGINNINFHISGSGPFTIQPTHDLPSITRPVIINGYSQPGSSVNTLSTGDNANLKIILSGNNYLEGNAYAGTGNGLVFSRGSTGSIVKGLVINGWINTGILVSGAKNISILGNFIGTNQQGTAQLANQAGIFASSANNIVIGTANPADRNIIAGSFFYFNDSACIEMIDANSASIQNNYIGTDITGIIALGNSLVGIECISCNAMTITNNVLSGHVIMGLSFIAVTNSFVQGNYIGTDVTGSIALGNGNMGISISGGGTTNSTANNTVNNNIISGNNIGIKLGYAGISGANNNIIKNNFIGTNAAGTGALANNYGIIVNDNTNTIGGPMISSHNVISGNTVGGILVYGPAINNAIRGNYIGVNATNSGALANGYGVQFGLAGGLNSASSNLVVSNIFGGSNTVTTLCP